MVSKTVKNKKDTETVKEELLNLLRESDAVEESDFNIQNITDQREAIEKMKHYDEIIKTGNKSTITILVDQQFILKSDFIEF